MNSQLLRSLVVFASNESLGNNEEDQQQHQHTRKEMKVYKFLLRFILQHDSDPEVLRLLSLVDYSALDEAQIESIINDGILSHKDISVFKEMYGESKDYDDIASTTALKKNDLTVSQEHGILTSFGGVRNNPFGPKRKTEDNRERP